MILLSKHLQMSDGKTRNNPWILNKEVLPHSTDYAGVMWHGSYLYWLEEARINALSQVGLAYADLSREGFEMPVVDLKIKYISPLHHGDKVLIQSWPLQQKGPRWPWETNLLLDGQKLVAQAYVDLVLVKWDQKKMHLLRNFPSDILPAIKKLQNGPI